jgi:hypothetical protein
VVFGAFPIDEESMLTSVKMVKGITSKMVINTGRSKTLIPASTAIKRIIEKSKHIILRTNTTLCHFSKPRGQKD